FSTMEITFFFNFPILLLGTICSYSFFSATSSQSRSLCYGLLLFSSTSIFTLLHYNVEPPSSYSLFVNFTIAGEGFAAAALAASVLWFLWTEVSLNRKKRFWMPNESHPSAL